MVEGHGLDRLIRTSTSKDYVLGPASVNFAVTGNEGCTQLIRWVSKWDDAAQK